MENQNMRDPMTEQNKDNQGDCHLFHIATRGSSRFQNERIARKGEAYALSQL
jgi:hypothetical protein